MAEGGTTKKVKVAFPNNGPEDRFIWEMYLDSWALIPRTLAEYRTALRDEGPMGIERDESTIRKHLNAMKEKCFEDNKRGMMTVRELLEGSSFVLDLDELPDVPAAAPAASR